MGKFIITIKRNGLYQFLLMDDSGTTLLSSGGYVSKLNCTSDISSIKQNVDYKDRIELKVSKQGECYFNIIHLDGYIVAKSEMFATEEDCKNRIALIRKSAQPAKIEDITS